MGKKEKLWGCPYSAGRKAHGKAMSCTLGFINFSIINLVGLIL